MLPFFACSAHRIAISMPACTQHVVVALLHAIAAQGRARTHASTSAPPAHARAAPHRRLSRQLPAACSMHRPQAASRTPLVVKPS
jgi:hypothetical protein